MRRGRTGDVMDEFVVWNTVGEGGLSVNTFIEKGTCGA